MVVYSAAVESLGSVGEATSPSGCSFPCFFLATNKLACRSLIAGCDDLTFNSTSTP